MLSITHTSVNFLHQRSKMAQYYQKPVKQYPHEDYSRVTVSTSGRTASEALHLFCTTGNFRKQINWREYGNLTVLFGNLSYEHKGRTYTPISLAKTVPKGTHLEYQERMSMFILIELGIYNPSPPGTLNVARQNGSVIPNTVQQHTQKKMKGPRNVSFSQEVTINEINSTDDSDDSDIEDIGMNIKEFRKTMDSEPVTDVIGKLITVMAPRTTPEEVDVFTEVVRKQGKKIGKNDVNDMLTAINNIARERSTQQHELKE